MTIPADIVQTPEWQYEVMLAVGRTLNNLSGIRVDQFEIDVQGLPIKVSVERNGAFGLAQLVHIRSDSYSNDPDDPRPDGNPACFAAVLPRRWLQMALERSAQQHDPARG